MTYVFADTYYWIALLNDRDQGHAGAKAISRRIQQSRLVTTQEVLSELLTYFSRDGERIRKLVTAFVRRILSNPAIIVFSQSDQSFLDGLALYGARLDKGYSLPDCVSMVTMRQHEIVEILTNDAHFIQEGFICLLNG